MIRAIVIAAMQKKGWTMYRLWKEIGKDKVSWTCIESYINGKTDITAGKLELIFGVLGIKVK